MSTTTLEKKGAFGRPVVQKPKQTETGQKKGFYIFKLIEEETQAKPVDKKTGEPVGDPYPALYIAPNSGVAINPETGEEERWRYLHGYNSIWEKDQQKPEPDKNRLGNYDGKNDIIFRTGKIKIMARDEAKLMALKVQDIFEGIGDNQIEPKPFKYTLVDPARNQQNLRNADDIAFEAESAARKAEINEMLAIGMALGIDVQNPDEDDDSIRTKFIRKSKENPALFLKVFNDPRNRIKYLVTKYMQEGSIKVNEGVLSYEGVQYASVRMDEDVAAQVATMTIEGDDRCKLLYDTLKSL